MLKQSSTGFEIPWNFVEIPWNKASCDSDGVEEVAVQLAL